MRNVYLSVLGTSPYVACNYETVENVRFVQEATLSLNCRDWTANDRIFILTTKEAYRKNWLDNGQKKSGDGLKTRIERLNLYAEAESVSIPSGKDIEEIWAIFNRIYDLLDDGDNVIFDITHAFRSIPMLAIVVLNYAKALKNINLHGIYYGAFEILGDPRAVKEKYPRIEDRIVPIFDLTAFNSLLEWSSAIHRFVKSGDASRINDLAESELKPILRDQLDRRHAAKQITRLSKQLVNFSRIMATCRGPEISGIIKTLKTFFVELEEIDLIPPMKPLMDQIQREIDRFSDNDARNGIQAAKWCLEHNMVQQGFTILQETLIACLVKKNGADMLDKEMREIVNSAVKIERDRMNPDKWLGAAAKHIEMTQRFIELFKKNKKLASLMNKLTSSRNDINHAGYKIQAKPAERFHGQLRECINDAEAIIEALLSEQLSE
jgi:CRISPR-associated Csx2 family protein